MARRSRARTFQSVRKLIVLALAVGTLAGAGPALASPTVRLTILHYVHGCHVWDKTKSPAARLVVRPGTKVTLRSSCPMDFDFAQTSGPKLARGSGRLHAGMTWTILFAKRGVYRFRAVNVQSSEQQGLQTLGPDNGLRLTVVVR
jgi:hypothetical protein